ncbi:SDR family NAD(P)-dependent oxidoreductase [Streptomyces sp. W16]|uniref:SDR family NAD(P)-dependent oxidoreductase n=1 Tax=Streptomyces sp. W16 TaxID=3076631 RepID=UPI00295B93DD|nr:SDR family NAD(P)-dependent oxidoreductase [Streptomyces sp. W16]MDV9174148.1 SDR family NAD(P)-dependent oxidoreductase [Streptomyces sp. W16]
MNVRLSGSRILLTGATGGLGSGMARELRARGAELILTGRRMDALERLAAEIGATTIAADLSVPADVTRLLDEAGPVDILISNAGLSAVGQVVDFSEEEITRALDVNLVTPILLARAVTPQLVGRGRGHIVLIGSLAGRTASKGSALYNSTKFGLRGFALAHRQDLYGTGVGVSIVEPTFVSDAGMYADSGVELPRGVRTVSPDDVTRAVIRSIEKNVDEIVVAPLEQRIQASLALVAPSVDARLQRMFGVSEVFGTYPGVTKR